MWIESDYNTKIIYGVCSLELQRQWDSRPSGMIFIIRKIAGYECRIQIENITEEEYHRRLKN